MVNIQKVDHEEVRKLRAAGLTFTRIGILLGISKQWASMIFAGLPPKKPDLDSKRTLSTRDVATLLGVHANTVRRWSDEGRLEYFRVCSRGDRRFRRKDIDRFIEGQGLEITTVKR